MALKLEGISPVEMQVDAQTLFATASLRVPAARTKFFLRFDDHFFLDK